MIQQQLLEASIDLANVPPEQYIFQNENIWSVYITKAIGAPSRYTQLFELLKNASSNDQIHFFLSTPGGRIDTTAQLLALMEATEAETTAHVMSAVASAGTLIALACDNLSVAPFGFMMLHNASGGSGYDKINLAVQSVQNSQIWCENIMRNVYKNFLTEKELDSLLENKDYYFNQMEILDRWENVLAAREALQEEMEKEQTEANNEAIEKAIMPAVEKLVTKLLNERFSKVQQAEQLELNLEDTSAGEEIHK